ncbi:MAG: PilZ domain-containing protein [Fibrobacteres bacterium]|nr:PilZ domain-containing protein [Fibrobacterota bacterium]
MDVRAQDAGDWHPAQLWDFSSTSFGFTLDAPSPIPIRTGSILTVRIRLDRRQFPMVEVRVRSVAATPDGLKVGVQRLDVDEFTNPSSRLPDQAAVPSLSGRIPHPILYGHASAFALSAVGPCGNFGITSQDPAVFLFPGCEARLCFDLPELMNHPLIARVRALRLDAQGRTEALLKATTIPRRLRKALSRSLPL